MENGIKRIALFDAGSRADRVAGCENGRWRDVGKMGLSGDGRGAVGKMGLSVKVGEL